MQHQTNVGKFIFFAVVIGAIFIFAVMRPGFFIAGNAASTAAAGSAASSSSNPPLLILPSLTADVGGQQNQGQASHVATSSARPGIGSTTVPPNLGVEAALVADLQTGSSSLSMNAAERWPMASVSKLMTAVIAANKLGSDQRITITEQMIAVDPSQTILHLGDTYTVADLLRIMLLPSNNVAAEALADFYGRTNFLAAMNAQAQAWGMADTYYDDPSGLSAANQSTADDLLKLAQNIYAQYPQILAITRTPQVMAQNLSTGQPVLIKSINDFAGQPDFIGGKTGYTDQADGNLLSLFQYNGRPIFIVVLGINDGVRFDGTQKLYNWFKANFK